MGVEERWEVIHLFPYKQASKQWMIAAVLDDPKEENWNASLLFFSLKEVKINGGDGGFFWQIGRRGSLYDDFHGWETWNRDFDSQEAIEQAISLLSEQCKERLKLISDLPQEGTHFVIEKRGYEKEWHERRHKM